MCVYVNIYIYPNDLLCLLHLFNISLEEYLAAIILKAIFHNIGELLTGYTN